MRSMLSACATLMMLASTATAGDVKVEGVHLCCGACVKGVGKALKDVSGVEGVTCDRDEGSVAFAAESADAAKSAINALAAAGFFGKAKHDGEEVAFPKSGAKEGAKADTVSVSNVHLCCGGCVNAVAKAVKKVDGVSDVTCDRAESSVKVTGSDVSVEAVVEALNGAGFNAKVK
ncbi:copper exporting ATPase [Maioricimonas rarisocia]|uniref:Copper exporting ATPase n=1 Tax=Maioricimonas rarisocia TaxID=2528026 RepID=A0A517Z2R4_9PLAN|nr:cation transporter [Maioricimonas rarisocia]QDU36780.1 copper exporting ATPase [Maioricimonas rarisocia]